MSGSGTSPPAIGGFHLKHGGGPTLQRDLLVVLVSAATTMIVWYLWTNL